MEQYHAVGANKVVICTSLIEADLRGAAKAVTGVGDRPRHIAEGVLKAIEAKSPAGDTGSPCI